MEMADLYSLLDGDIENYVKVTKISSTLSTFPTMYLCKFSQNPSTGSKYSAQKPYFGIGSSYRSSSPGVHFTLNI